MFVCWQMACAPLRATLRIRREPTATKVPALKISQLNFAKLSRKETQQHFQTLFGVTLVTWLGQETTLRLYRWKNSYKTGKSRLWFSDVAFGAWKQKWKEWCFLLLQDTLFHPVQGFSVYWQQLGHFSVSHCESSLCSSRAKGTECAVLQGKNGWIQQCKNSPVFLFCGLL